MARYVKSGEYTQGSIYAPKKGKLPSLDIPRRNPPTFAGDEVQVKMGPPDHYLIGPERLGGIVEHNPAHTERQRRFFGAELSRKRAGKKTKTGLSEAKLRDFARKG